MNSLKSGLLSGLETVEGSLLKYRRIAGNKKKSSQLLRLKEGELKNVFVYRYVRCCIIELTSPESKIMTLEDATQQHCTEQNFFNKVNELQLTNHIDTRK